jgi:uncharacterized protein YndB with AHSA1/START domain
MTEQKEQADARLGEVLRDGDRVGLRYERRLAHPPEKVWRAITESENLRHWFPADIVGERRAGARVRMPFWPESVEHGAAELEAAGVDLDDAILPGEIRSWDPPRLFELIWGDRDSDLLRFELEPEGTSTRLVFTTWLGAPGPGGHAGTGAGYHVCLDALEELLDTGSVTVPADLDTGPLQEKYAALTARSEQATAAQHG